ncbi:MAG: histidine ammonia-lyase [candidate division KSB1 bacterium]|nr:histidine ammonia-lyase [candidate division KSB1 bacterium]
MNQVLIDGTSLSLQSVHKLVHEGYEAAIAPEARERMQQTRQTVEGAIASGQIVYGVNTGFGKLSSVIIPHDQIEELQRNLVLSHACGVGDPIPTPIVRTALVLKANSLCKGYSGVRLIVAELVVELFNRNVTPIIPCKGSVGASGDLAPLAHLTLVMMGMGEALIDGARLSGGEALHRVGLQPLKLQAKEGLALLNGTQITAAYAVEALTRALQLSKIADIAGAMSTESLLGTNTAFDERIHRARGHKEQIQVAANLRALMADSEIVAGHRTCSKVQDAYSSRCIPQVHGAVRQALRYVQEVVETELNSCTDNPLVFSKEGEILSGGNFHAQPLSLACDVLSVAVSQLANISERRLENLMDPVQSGLPAFLTRHGGLHSGLMIAQVTAAALVSENKVLSHPASVDSIPTSANQEDFVSMGTHSARKALEIVENAETVLAVELLAACQALDLRGTLKPGIGSEAARRIIRRSIPTLDEDRLIQTDIQTLLKLIRNGDLLHAVEAAVGPM